MNVIDEARQVIEQLVPQLQAEGHTVYLEPSRQLLPPFMDSRNRLIHGTLNESIDPAELTKFIDILKTLRQMTQESAV